jgi:hypothetical protein
LRPSLCALDGSRLLDVLLDSSQPKMAAMSIYKVLRKTERFGVSFCFCDTKYAGVREAESSRLISRSSLQSSASS